MAEILKEWLTERLQRPISWDAEDFGLMMRNGHVIACVLQSYHVINEEKYFLIRANNNIEDIKGNWKYLKEWLREVEVDLSDNDLENVIEGKGTVLLRIFYQLFLHLDKKDRIDFIKRERKMVSNLVTKTGQRFQVNKIDEEKEPAVENLSRPLLNEKHFIEWQKKKTEQVKETYDYMRHKYSKMLQKIEETKTPLDYKAQTSGTVPNTDHNDMEQFSQKFPCNIKNYTYEELLDMEANVAKWRESLIDSKWTQNYMDNLYTKIDNRTESEEFQKQMTNVLSGSLWDMTINEEETKLDTELAKKVMKLSQFEKQMCTQIMETKQQARNLFNNRVQAEKEFAEQREQHFNQYLDNIKEQIHLEVVEIDFEKQRQNMLHQRLYNEKMSRKRQHYYEICYDTMLSIVDYATRYAYFKRLIGDEIPDHYIHEWKILYFRQQPIFEVLTPTEDLLQDPGFEEEVAPEEEEIIRLELERQEAMNETDFLEYHNYIGPWKLEHLIPNFEPESEERTYERLGMRVLGHVVFTLLEIKYPYPPVRPPADLPDFPSKALLRNLPDKAMTNAMQQLLKFKQIHVVKLEAAINMCLKKFKSEMVGCTDIELSFDKFIAAAQEEPDKELIKLMKTEEENVSKSSDSYTPAVVGALPVNVKQTQTPKTIPEEDIKLSPAADLGKYAYETLSVGDSLTDYLLVAMLVEYVKDQDDIQGFVIINYPNSYREAQILEESFSGRAPPDKENLEDRDDIYLEETIAKHRKKERDQYKEVRSSKLVIDPHKKRIEKPFESYFTCYIQLKETEDILQEFVIWDLTEENSELIDRFYAILGLNYSMYYEVIEKDFLAQICKYIIGDYDMPLKSSDRLFGENILSNLDFPSTDDKRNKSKIVKPVVSNSKSKERLRQGSKNSRQSINLEVVKEASSTEAIMEDTLIVCEGVPEEEEVRSYQSYEEMKVLAGEPDWDYGEIPIAEIIGAALATCWEQVEKVYIHDMQQLFFAIRLQMNCLVPYCRFIKDKMEQIITLPSHKQDLVSRFQREYNEAENDWRDINLTKNEWHCRVKELQNRLYHICDERKLFAEQQRQALIMENWAMEELTSMVNSYISCMQAELNRSILTFQALHDFYFAQLKRLPPNDRLVLRELSKVFRESDETSGSKKGGEEKVFRHLRLAFQELQLKDIQIDYSNNPLNMIVENNVKFALKTIKDTNDSYRSLISREYTEYAKQVTIPKKKEDNSSVETICSQEIFKQNALKCIDEWNMAINGEMFRACLRIMALQYKSYRDMKLFNDNIYRTFVEVQNDINTYYLNEIKSVDRLCKYLQLAVESGRKIAESLILEHDSLIIDPNLLQVPPPGPSLGPPKVGDYVTDTEFKISQLARLRSQFKIVAPTGITLQQAFIYLIQDFIVFGKETCEGSLLPEAWKRIDPEQISKLVFLLFGETAYIDWRDFLIYCLNIRYPTVEDLLDVRHSFRCNDQKMTELIGRDDFIAEELWFEQDFDIQDPCARLRNNLIKHFLFELYETSENMMNYSAFLLAFCKNPNPIEGFTSALSVAIGKKTCSSIEECEEVVCKMVKLKQYRDECRACALKCTQHFLDKVINNVVNSCESTTITELEYIAPIDDKKGGKSSKMLKASKSRKLNESSTQSARSLRQKSLHNQTKVAQSATDVKTTFICPPCAEDEVVEEKPQEKEEVEEEQKSVSPQDNPTLAYAVSQEVIWNVLRICLPWHFRLLPEEKVTPYVGQVQEIMSRLKQYTDNGDIYVCRFVTEPDICKLLHKVRKFTALNFAEEMRKIML